MKKKQKIPIFVVAGILVITGIAIATVIKDEKQEKESPLDIKEDNGVTSPSFDYTGGAQIIPGQYLETKYNEITGDYRPLYENMTEEQIKNFFDELPTFPKDFFNIAQLIYEGKVTDYARIGLQYYMQPEFYPAWFGLVDQTYSHNNPKYWTPEGYGCYPTIKEASVPKGKSITVNTYFRTAFATEAYQGIILKPVFPDKAVDLKGSKIFDQPENAENYLSAKITNEDNAIYESFKDQLMYDNVDENEWFAILKPTYQRILNEDDTITEEGFPSDWVRILELQIDIAPDTPSGFYVVAIDVEIPCFDINQEFYYSQEHEYYGGLYRPAGSIHKTSTPHFQVILKVI